MRRRRASYTRRLLPAASRRPRIDLSRCVSGRLAFGTGAALTGDVVRLLQSLPEEGDIAIRLSTRTGAAQDGSFLLGGLKMVRDKVAAACKWSHAVAKPRN